jgi:hypothetical protein
MYYVDGDPAHSSETTKAQKPLAAAEVQVEEVEGNPGYYQILSATALSARGFDGLNPAVVEASVRHRELTNDRRGDRQPVAGGGVCNAS